MFGPELLLIGSAYYGLKTIGNAARFLGGLVLFDREAELQSLRKNEFLGINVAEQEFMRQIDKRYLMAFRGASESEAEINAKMFTWSRFTFDATIPGPYDALYGEYLLTMGEKLTFLDAIKNDQFQNQVGPAAEFEALRKKMKIGKATAKRFFVLAKPLSDSDSVNLLWFKEISKRRLENAAFMRAISPAKKKKTKKNR